MNESCQNFVHKRSSIFSYLRFCGQYAAFNVGFPGSVVSAAVLFMYSLISVGIANSVYEA